MKTQIKSRNLFDIGKEIENTIKFIESNNEHIISVEINEYTLNYLKEKGIYGFRFNDEIPPIIINNFLSNFSIKFNREKRNKSTEYEPYKLEELESGNYE